jgi:urea transporter/murein DD-endopeptidase MepM/ murein hydrolase activator NlpD
LKRSGDIQLFLRAIPNSYGQVFFSDQRLFSFILMVITFSDLYAGLMGMLSVIVTNLTGFLLGFDRRTIARGVFGFNSLLVGLGLGVYFKPDLLLILVIIMAAILTLLISVSLQGVIGKYALPFLSVPFLLAIWIMTLSTREFTALGISERGIYTFNDLYTIGGDLLVRVYEWWNDLELARSLRIYFISLAAILFQFNLLSGILLATGLLLFSRIAFSLSLIGFYTAYLFYELIGANISEVSYSYIGFNYILTSIAVGGFFIIPSKRSYLWVVLLIPVVAMITISLSRVLAVFSLPVYSLPFNLVVLLFLYALKFRLEPSVKLAEVLVQHNSPEKNLYAFHNDVVRFRHRGKVGIRLPFLGTWTVSQAHNGEYTHKDEFRHAWDFVITDPENKQYMGSGEQLSDYHCYDKMVLAPADGTIAFIQDHIPDNPVGEVNLKDNWGNTVVIRHDEHLYTSLSHLKEGSIRLREGDAVKEGDEIGRCGNSGRSPYPHLHFQVQATPYIGSVTLRFPVSHYILHSGAKFSLESYAFPRKDDLLSNIERNDLLYQAFHLIPGRRFHFRVKGNGDTTEAAWEVETDAYNNSYIRCERSGAMAYFINDGNLIYFTHYSGDKKALLYYFFLAAFQVQQGFYQDLAINDRYPLNLIFHHPLLGLQDFVAPFWKFLRSTYECRYEWIDNEMSPSEIRLRSAARNYISGKLLRGIDFSMTISEKGIRTFVADSGKLHLEATCED